MTEHRAERDRGEEPPGRRRASVGWLWRALGALIVAFRLPVILAWAGAAVAATVYLPAIASSGGIGGLIPARTPAIRAEVDAARLFGEPLASAEVAVVQRDPARFPRATEEAAARHAAAVDQGRVTGIPGLAAALPVGNAGRILPGSREQSTTIITFLFFRPGTPIGDQAAGGHAYAHRYLGAPRDHLAGITGPAPAQDAQSGIIIRHLPWVEAGTVLAIALIVGFYFRSVTAPLACLACSAVAYLVALRLVGWIAYRAGLTVPPDLEPVLVVLLLGVTTDYSVFFLAGMRSRLADGQGRLAAARSTTAEFLPIIVTAGLVVAAGIASLAFARIGALRAFGPALAITVLIAMVVAVTLAPALIATFGRRLFRGLPARPQPPARQAQSPQAQSPQAPPRTAAWRDRGVRIAASRPVAAVAAAACVAGLAIGAWGLPQIKLGFPLIHALPSHTEAARAQAAADRGFVPGILEPTEILAVGPAVTRQQAAMTRLQHLIARQPGVAGVLGPADFGGLQQRLGVHPMLASSGRAARWVVIQRTDPLGPKAIGQVRQLTADLPGLARRAGLTGARFEVGGEAALAGQAIAATAADLWRIALLIAVINVVLLAIFLRSLLAPLYLLAASVLALLCALGLTVWIFQGLLGYGGLVYYVPFTVAVLLVSLGSDYNIFVVGRIWEAARDRPLRDAVATAVPRASRAITMAALALAAGFAMLALVPLAQFREIAVAMVLGILIDAFIVRSVLVPALVLLFGDAGRWPGRRGQQVPSARDVSRARPRASHAPP